MSKATTIILATIALATGILVFYFGQNQQPADAVSKWEPKTDEQANVTVTVTPVELSAEAQEWKFDIAMNTHSLELDQDLVKSVILIDDRGKEYRLLSWIGPVGSHHREGTLIFNPITPTPKSVELKISGIGNVIRSFAWQLR